MTVNDLINSSLRMIGALASGESPTSAESNDALTALNQMIDLWSTQRLMVYSTVSESFTLTGGKQSYTWGTGGDFNSARPQGIDVATIQFSSGSTTSELPIEIITEEEWAEIRVKNVQTSVPRNLYFVASYPMATVYLWPIPSTSNSLNTWSWKPLSSFSGLTTTITLPPGYAEALKTNLAIRLAPEFGAQVTPELQEWAKDSKAAIKRINTTMKKLGTDEALLGARKVFNIYTGE